MFDTYTSGIYCLHTPLHRTRQAFHAADKSSHNMAPCQLDNPSLPPVRHVTPVEQQQQKSGANNANTALQLRFHIDAGICFPTPGSRVTMPQR